MRFVIDQAMMGMATMTIAVVRKVDAANKRVSVQPMVAQLDASGKALDHGTIHNIPYGRHQSGTWAIVIDPQVGDMGVIMFAQGDISTVVNSKQPAPPGSRRKFDWSDAVYAFTVASMAGEPTQFVKIDGGGVTITSESDVTINVSGTATVNGNAKIDGDAEITGTANIKTLVIDGNPYLLHKHSGVTTGGGVSGVVAP